MATYEILNREGAKALIDALKGYADTVAANVEFDSSALEAQIQANLANITKNEEAIALLNEDAQTKGSVANMVATAVTALVNGADQAYDTLGEIAEWIIEHGDVQEVLDAISDAEDLARQALKKVEDAQKTADEAKATAEQNKTDIASIKSTYATKEEVASAKSDVIETAASDATTKADAAKAYADGLAKNYATAAQGALAEKALQPEDFEIITASEIELMVNPRN